VVQISLAGIPIDSAVSVVVVSFELGPHIVFYWPDENFNPSIPLPPGNGFILAATVSYLTAGCLITWTTSSDSGYSYLTSKRMVNNNANRNTRLEMFLNIRILNTYRVTY